MKQQGDVLFNRIGELPGSLKKVDKKLRGYVLAEGETSGHAHVITDDVELYERDGTLYLSVTKPEGVAVTHEEHLPVTLEPGFYEIGIVQEFDPFSEQVKKVVD